MTEASSFHGWFLRPKRSADVLGDHADRGLRQAKRQRGPARNQMWTLTGDIERQLLGAFAGGDDATRLHRRLRDALMHDFLSDEVRRALEQRFEFLVDLFVAHLLDDVALAFRDAPAVRAARPRWLTTGSSSAYSTSTSEAASSAMWRLSAMTSATGSPT